MDEIAEVACPVCGERFEIPIDPSEGSEQEWGMDCPVCCRPLEIVVRLSGRGRAEVEARAE